MSNIPPNANGSATSANSSPVVIASDQATIPVSLASVPSHAVTNAGTFAVQASAGTNLNTSALALDATLGTTNTEIGGLTETAPASDTASSGLNGRLQRIAQRLTTLIGSTIAVSGTFWQATQPVSGTFWQATQPVSGTVTTTPPSNASTNIAQINAVTPLMGNGITGTGSQRVTIASDNTAFSVNANAGTNLNTSALALETGGNLATIKTNTDNLALAQASTTSGQKGNLSQGAVTTAAPTYTTAQTNPLSLTTSGALRVDIGATSANATAIKVDGSAVTHPVSGTVTATQATGTNLHTVVDSGTVTTVSTVTNLSQLGGAAISMGTGVRGAGVQRVTIATDDLVPVSLASVPSHAVTNAGTFAVQSAAGGDVAHDGVDSGNPVKIGGKATNVEPAAVSASGDRANFITDMVGKQITLPYANPENFVSGAITTAMTGTTTTSLVAAPAAGLRNYITTIIVSNSHATVGTDIIIQDGSGGTTLLTIPAAAVYGGAVINLPVPLRQPTTATAIFCANVTTGASTKVSAVGYKGA